MTDSPGQERDTPMTGTYIAVLVVAFGAAWGATGAAGAVLVATIVFVAFWTVLFLRIRREPESENAPAPPQVEVATP